VAEGFNVDASQLYRHASNVRAVQEQLTAIKGASRAIAQNDAAYGLLCGWISAILEGRHVRQDTLYTYVEENLSLAIEALNATAKDYESTDSAAHDRIHQAGRMG
jgi:hypothetical protein